MNGWARDLARAALVIAVSSATGLLINAAAARPIPLGSADGPGAWPERAPRIQAAALAKAPGLLLLDVRDAVSFREGHPTPALHAPAMEFMSRYRDLNLATLLRAAKTIVVLCDNDSCPAADRVAKLLKDLGHQGVFVLDGGWRAYRASGLPRVGS